MVVRHHMLNARVMGLGGSQYVMLETAIAFAERGVETFIDSPFIKSRCDLLKLADFFGSNTIDSLNIGIGEPDNPRVVINTSGDVLSGPGDIVYLHYPFFLDYSIYYTPVGGIFDLIGKVYSLMNMIAFPIFIKGVKQFIANSSFTANLFNKYLGLKPIVIYPPVNIDDIINERPLGYDERENYVLIVSRISPEKHPELAIYLAKLLRKDNTRVVLAGSASNYSEIYYESLLEQARREKVDDNIDIYLNIPREKLVELYRKAFIYLHITPKEHFGISIAEAMAAGTPVIIPINSGSWFDIALEDPNIATPYKTLCEVVDIVRDLKENRRKWEFLSNNGYQRALQLDKRVFRRKIFEVVRRFIE
ncbi:MAG: glycosyltransferase [Desulfurococcaceae archaeon]